MDERAQMHCTQNRCQVGQYRGGISWEKLGLLRAQVQNVSSSSVVAHKRIRYQPNLQAKLHGAWTIDSDKKRQCRLLEK